MGTYVAIHDRRLAGGVPERKGLTVINTNAHTQLREAFGGINYAARKKGPVDALFVLCHGYAGYNDNANVSMDAGGMGLKLGQEGVVHENVAMWKAIANHVKIIVVYSCAAANTEPGNEGTGADGRYLIGALAIHTKAKVYAADRIQWYGKFNNLKHGRFEWGNWEGTLYEFTPNGNSPTMVARAPIEFADVMNGTAP